MYLLLSLVFVFGLIGESVSPNPTCGKLSESKKPCTTGTAPDSRYQYTIEGQITCGGKADFDESGVEPKPRGRAYTSLWLKSGSTSSGYKEHAADQFGGSMVAYNHENIPFNALRQAPSNRFLLYGKDKFSGTLYPWIRVYGPSCKGAGRDENIVGKTKRTWWFYIYDTNCENDYGNHYSCAITLDLDLGPGKYEGKKDNGVTAWDGQGTTFYYPYDNSGSPTWARDQDRNIPIDPPWTPGPLDPADIEATRDTKKKDKSKKKNIKKNEKETKKKKEEKNE